MKSIIRSTAVTLLLLFAALCSAAQTKNIRLQSGKKTILKGQVRKGTDRLYTFGAEAGQKLTVRLVSAGKTSVFSVNLQDREEYETIKDNLTSWSGELPESDSGIYSIAVKTLKPAATFTIEITLQ